MWSSDFKWSQMNSTIQMFPKETTWGQPISNVFKCVVTTSRDFTWFQVSALFFSWVRLNHPPILLSNFTFLYWSIEIKRETQILVHVSEVGGLSSPLGRLPVTGKSFRVLHACVQCSCKLEMRLKWDAPRSPFSFFGTRTLPFSLQSSTEFKWFPVTSADCRWFQMISNDWHWFRMKSNEFKWLQMISTDFNWSQSIFNDFKWHQMSWTHFKWRQLIPSDFKWLQVLSPNST
jgi:hypothetical protein